MAAVAVLSGRAGLRLRFSWAALVAPQRANNRATLSRGDKSLSPSPFWSIGVLGGVAGWQSWAGPWEAAGWCLGPPPYTARLRRTVVETVVNKK